MSSDRSSQLMWLALIGSAEVDPAERGTPQAPALLSKSVSESIPEAQSAVTQPSYITPLAVLIQDCLCEPLWHWQNTTPDVLSATLVREFQTWVAENGLPEQEKLDWWLAEWQQQTHNHVIGQWAELTQEAANRLLYGLGRLARHETGVLWENPPIKALAQRVNERASQHPAEALTVLWLMEDTLSSAAVSQQANWLSASLTQPVQVLVLESPQPHPEFSLALKSLLQPKEQFRLSRKLAKSGVMDGTALPQLQDAVLRMNLPAHWLPPCQT